MDPGVGDSPKKDAARRRGHLPHFSYYGDASEQFRRDAAPDPDSYPQSPNSDPALYPRHPHLLDGRPSAGGQRQAVSRGALSRAIQTLDLLEIWGFSMRGLPPFRGQDFRGIRQVARAFGRKKDGAACAGTAMQNAMGENSVCPHSCLKALIRVDPIQLFVDPREGRSL